MQAILFCPTTSELFLPDWPRPLAARLRPLAYGCMLALLLLNAGSSEAFIYFQF